MKDLNFTTIMFITVIVPRIDGFKTLNKTNAKQH